jgi:hypothetical protein
LANRHTREPTVGRRESSSAFVLSILWDGEIVVDSKVVGQMRCKLESGTANVVCEDVVVLVVGEDIYVLLLDLREEGMNGIV